MAQLKMKRSDFLLWKDQSKRNYRKLQVLETYLKRVNDRVNETKTALKTVMDSSELYARETREIEALTDLTRRLNKDPLDTVRQPIPPERIFTATEMHPELTPFDPEITDLEEEAEYAAKWRKNMVETIQDYGTEHDITALNREAIDPALGTPCPIYSLEKNCQMEKKCYDLHACEECYYLRREIRKDHIYGELCPVKKVYKKYEREMKQIDKTRNERMYKKPQVADLEERYKEKEEELNKLKDEIALLKEQRKRWHIKEYSSTSTDKSRSPSPVVIIRKTKRKHVTERSFDSETESSQDDLRNVLKNKEKEKEKEKEKNIDKEEEQSLKPKHYKPDKKTRVIKGQHGKITITTVRDDTSQDRKKSSNKTEATNKTTQ